MSKKTKTTKVQQQPGNVISHCSFTNEAFVVSEHVANAVRAVAAAAEANARALERLADRLAGPADHRVAIRLDQSR